MDTQDFQETWAAVPCCPAYEVSDLGKVRRIAGTRGCRDGRAIKTRIDRGGYERVALSLGARGKWRHTHVHVLVAEAFLGPKPGPDFEVAHGDGIRSNNRLQNIRWATPKENAQDRAEHGLWNPAKGSVHWRAKLTEGDVLEIRAALADGEKPSDLADRFGVSRPTLSDIAKGRTWGHVVAP